MPGLRGGQNPGRTPGRVLGQLDGTFEKGRLRRQATSGPRPIRAPFQVVGDVLVGTAGCVRPVPCPAVGIELRIGLLGEREVRGLQVAQLRGSSNGGPRQRVSEPDPDAHLDQAGLHRRSRGREVDIEPLNGPSQQVHVPDGLQSSRQQEQARRSGKPFQALREPLFQASLQRHGVRQAEPESELGRRETARKLQQRQRIATCLGHDRLAHAAVDVAWKHGVEQRTSIAVRQPSHLHGRLPDEHPVLAHTPHRDDQPNRFGHQAPGHERECLCRGDVQPLRVIDRTHQRLLLRHVREQAQHRQSDHEPVRWLSGVHPESRGQRVPLRSWEVIEVVQHRRAQLVQAGEGQLDLGLDTHRSCHPAPWLEPTRQIVQEGCLADPRLAAQHEHLAPAGVQAAHQGVERRALASACRGASWPWTLQVRSTPVRAASTAREDGDRAARASRPTGRETSSSS